MLIKHMKRHKVSYSYQRFGFDLTVDFC